MNKNKYYQKINNINKRIKVLEKNIGDNNSYVEAYRAKAHALGIAILSNGKLSKSFKSELSEKDLKKLEKLSTYTSLKNKIKKEYGEKNLTKKDINKTLSSRSALNTSIENMMDFLYGNKEALQDFVMKYVENENQERKKIEQNEWIDIFDYFDKEYGTNFQLKEEYKEFFK